MSRSLVWYWPWGNDNDGGNETIYFFSDWWYNGTFNVTEFQYDINAGTSQISNRLHPASDVDVMTVLATTVFNCFVFVCLILSYEVLRRFFPNVYASRQRKEAQIKQLKLDGHDVKHFSSSLKYSKLPDVYSSTTPLEWMRPVFGVSWKKVREAAGLDAYMYLRYIRMCLRITSITALWGIIILWPVYAMGGNEAPGWYHISMANIHQGSIRIWVPTIFMYFFTAFVYYVMKQEYKHYVELRMEWLGLGVSSAEDQHRYSLMIENLPKEMRSDGDLYDYFDKLFPNRIHSANVAMHLPVLDPLKSKKVQVLHRLEKAIAVAEATKKRPTHIKGQPRISVCGLEACSAERFCCDKCLKFHNVDDDNPVEKGEMVDSISYYTKALQKINQKMFILQKQKRQIAEEGNKSTRNGWFSEMSDFADRYIEGAWSDDTMSIETMSSEEYDAPLPKASTWAGAILTNSRDDSCISFSSDNPDSRPSGEKDSGSSSSYFEYESDSLGNESRISLDMTVLDKREEAQNNEQRRRSSFDSNSLTPVAQPSKDQSCRDLRPGILSRKRSDMSARSHVTFSDLRAIESLSRSTSSRSRTRDRYRIQRMSSTFDSHESDKSTVSEISLPPRQPVGERKANENKLTSTEPRRFKHRTLRKASMNDTFNTTKSQPLLHREEDSNEIGDRLFAKKNKEKKVQIGGNFKRRKQKSEEFKNTAPKSLYASFPKTKGINKRKKLRRTKSFWGKVAGRLGLDFAAYMVKLTHRQLFSVIEEEIIKDDTMSSTGFVTFTDLTSVTCAASAPLTHRPEVLASSVAPEAREILWENIPFSAPSNKVRKSHTNNFMILGAILWSIPVACIQAMASAETVVLLTGWDWVITHGDGKTYDFVNAYLPVVFLLTIIMLLPYIFEWVAVSYERLKTQSEVERSILNRYFYYQLANIYITVTAGSLWKSATDILARPSAGLEILGNSIPTVVGYFIALLSTKILAGLPIIILRVGALSRYFFLRLINRKKLLTQRELNSVYLVEPLYYGWEYPTQLLVIVICFTYACISPVILIFGAIYFAGALMVYKKQVLYCYTPSYESGGSLFPMVCQRTIFGLMCGQLTFIGYSSVRGGYFQPIVLTPLLLISWKIMNYFKKNFAVPSTRLTLERAMTLDEQLGNRVQHKHSYSPNNSPTNSQDLPAPQKPLAKNVHENFGSDHYRQPVLREPPALPLFYRPEYDDKLTREARQKLNANRIHMWDPARRSSMA